MRPEDERLLDLLVDGELAEDKRRALLERLDREPGGWRSCALAFLEAQSWQREMGAIADNPPLIASPPLSQAQVEPTSRAVSVTTTAVRQRRVPTFLAMAASFLVAFLLGLMIWGWGNKEGQLPQPGQLARQESPSGGSSGTIQTIHDLKGQPWQNVTVVADDGSSRQMALPVVEGQPFDDPWLFDRPSALPPDVQRALERMGNSVRTQRRLVPFHLEDGRRGVVPMDQIEVQPASVRSFQ